MGVTSWKKGIYDQLTTYDNANQESDYKIGEGEQQDFMDQLTKMISTQTQMSSNRASEAAAFNKASPSTQRATQRGIAYQGAQAGEQGAFDLQKFMATFNRQGTQMMQDNRFRQQGLDIAKQQADTNFWNQLMQILSPAAGGLGYSLGVKLAK